MTQFLHHEYKLFEFEETGVKSFERHQFLHDIHGLKLLLLETKAFLALFILFLGLGKHLDDILLWNKFSITTQHGTQVLYDRHGDFKAHLVKCVT